MDRILVLSQAVSENIEGRRGSFVAHNVSSLILTEVIPSHVEEVLLLALSESDVVLPKLAFDLSIVLVGLLLYVLQARLIHDLLDRFDLAWRCGHCILTLIFPRFGFGDRTC